MQAYNEVQTHIPTSPTQEHTNAQTTSHSPFALLNIRDCGSSSTPNEHHDMCLCFSAPLSLWSLTRRNSTVADFFLFQKQYNCYLFLVIFLCCCCCWGPQTQDNGLFRTGLVSVSSCMRHRRCGQDQRRVPVLLQQRLNIWITSFEVFFLTPTGFK